MEVGVAFQSLSEDWQRDCQRIVTCHNLNGLDPTVTLESEAMSFDWKRGVHLEKSCCNQLVHVECRCVETKRFYFACLVCKPLIGLRLESTFARIQRHPFAKSSIDWPGCQCLNAICAAKGLHGAEPLSTWPADQALVGLTSEEDRQHLV